MKSQKLFRTIVLAALVFGLGFAQSRNVSASDNGPGPRKAKATCYKATSDNGPGPRSAKKSCYKTASDNGPGPR